MDCRVAEDLFSDHLEGTLPEELRADFERHLRECGSCRLLRAAFGEVVAALHALPLVDAPRGLAERAACAARTAPAAQGAPVAVSTRMPPWLQVAAALLAVVITGGLAAASRAWPGSGPLGPRLAERRAVVGDYLTERKDRLVEDVRLLKVVVETAFEERLDRVGERIEDYRRLLARRRALEQQQQRRERPTPAPESRRDFSNPAAADAVPLCEPGRPTRTEDPSEARPACNPAPRTRLARDADRREGARS